MPPSHDRYQITKPVRDGFEWWTVVDTQNDLALITVSAQVKQAAVWVHGMCAQLNRLEGPTGPHPHVLVSEETPIG